MLVTFLLVVWSSLDWTTKISYARAWPRFGLWNLQKLKRCWPSTSAVYLSRKSQRYRRSLRVSWEGPSGRGQCLGVRSCTWLLAVLCLVSQSCPVLCNSMDYSPPGSFVHGILQARILEWVAMPFSRGSSQPRDRTQVFCIAGGRFFIIWATKEAQEYWSG